ncbi:molybdopterin synthase sulfur carrier subunit [Chryseobacterium sp. Leaf180]|jgi:molybdopterin synthase sulfur carrier subunit|uniref:MoaD/ThiS family protein n=1 Tax=Chryseobacterium sp. Leaf180 TaxID=1736289 RepID=UPI0006F30206|nr:MoaD/ThiS family protein [Chryseobacterium sp. Leaf180]KQR94807.1 molybdopterin synthase sulfur carrier subunit [Chryseobacterium sp. Leaf180]
MKLKLLAFGIATDIFGADKIFLEVDDQTTVKDLKQILEEKYDTLRKIRSYFVAVNEEYAEENQILTCDSEIAIIPPVSGG